MIRFSNITVNIPREAKGDETISHEDQSTEQGGSHQWCLVSDWGGL